ncbi:MAG: ABC transporter ATP-binding protein [Christensenellales bacterium]|jgi:ATP-binding cassette subfamily B protein IrtB
MFKSAGRIIRWCGPFKSRFIWGCVFAFFASVFMALPIMGAAYFLSLMLEGAALSAVHGLYALLFMAAMVMGRFLFSYLQATFQESILYELSENERVQIGDVLKRVSLGFFQKNRTGDLSAAVSTDLSFLEMFAMRMVTTVVNGYIGGAVMVLGLALFSPPIALVSLAGILLSLVFLSLMGYYSKKNGRVHQQTIDDSTAATLEYIRGIPVVKAYGQRGASVDGIRRAYRNAKDINIKIEKNFVVCNVLHLLSLKLASVGIVCVAGYLTIQGAMPLPIFLMMAMYSFTVFAQVEGINNATHVLVNIGVIMDKLEGIKKADFIDENGKDISLGRFDIEMDRVSFAYDKRDVLKDVSFVIPESSTTAIVGPSGGGKSTLCNLIARFYDVNRGSVKIGGIDVREMTCDSLLSNISMVFQNVYLFRDTIANNIRFGKPGASMDEIIDAAKAARCHDFITALPEGYDTLVGEGGSSLSGGEKQRISIARAMLKNAPIVILDEATASVDPENEHHIQQAITALTKGKTIVAIAHRLATIEHADQILVVEDGRISQRGTHEELLRRDGTYKRFVDIRKKAEGWEIA